MQISDVFCVVLMLESLRGSHHRLREEREGVLGYHQVHQFETHLLKFCEGFQGCLC